MISVLIPIYNTNVINLVNKIHEQLVNCKIAFEIICLDDCSNNDINDINSKIEILTHTILKVSKSNNGIVKTRQLLSNLAKYNWLLFLDSDTVPKKDTFVSNYIEYINNDFEIIFGGFSYKKSKPGRDSLLRWKYGKSCEEVDALIRNKQPYKIVISGNMFVKKKVFNSIISMINDKAYGLDNYFGSLLKQNNIKVLHINNEVYHLGIEKSDVYLKKKEQAANTLLKLYKEEKMVVHDNNLLKWFVLFKCYKLNYLFAYFFKLFSTVLKMNLLCKHPSITALQLYRLSYMCYEDLKKPL